VVKLLCIVSLLLLYFKFQPVFCKSKPYLVVNGQNQKLYGNNTKCNICDKINTSLGFKAAWWFLVPKAIWALVVYRKYIFSHLYAISVFLSITSTVTWRIWYRCLFKKFPLTSVGIRRVYKTVFALQDPREHQCQTQKCTITLLSFSPTSSSLWRRKWVSRPRGAPSHVCDQGVRGLGHQACQDAHLLCRLDIA